MELTACLVVSYRMVKKDESALFASTKNEFAEFSELFFDAYGSRSLHSGKVLIHDLVRHLRGFLSMLIGAIHV
jgi:hypothetical protein